MFQINGAVPPDVHEVDLAALLLQCGQRTAHGGMLQRRGDDVLSHMAGRLHDALERKVVGFARAGGVDDLLRTDAQQPRNALRHAGHFRLRCLSGGVGGVGVADIGLLRAVKRFRQTDRPYPRCGHTAKRQIAPLSAEHQSSVWVGAASSAPR